MRHSLTILKILLISSLFFANLTVNAAQFKEFANLQVHYIALPSTFIQPNIAKKYNIKRSRTNGLLNISILDKKQKNKAIAAVITGTGQNLIGQIYQLKFTEIKEGEAIYYLADYPYLNEEIVNFKINIKTQRKSNTLKFQHKFYVD